MVMNGRKDISMFRNWLLALAPSIVTVAIVFGPSKITITSKMGALYEYGLLWVVVVAIFFMIVFINMASRIGIATPQSLLTTIRLRYGKWMSRLMGLGIFLVATAFQVGNSVGVGLSVAEATDTTITPWIVLFNLIGITLLFFRDFYKTLERLMMVIVGLMLFAFFTTVFLVKPNFRNVLTGFIPAIPDESVGLIIAFFASCFPIVGAFYQVYLVQAKKRINPDKGDQGKGLTGMVILGLMCTFVIVCAAAVLHPQNIPVNNASDMASALEPLF